MSAQPASIDGPASVQLTVAYGFWIFLLSDIIMFSALFAAYAVLVGQTAGGPGGPNWAAAGTAGIYCALYVGSTSVITNFDAEQALGILARERITFTNLVPTTIQRLLAREDFDRHDLSALDTLLYGGSPRPGSRNSASRRVRSRRSPAGCPAAINRRSCSASGSPTSRAC